MKFNSFDPITCFSSLLFSYWVLAMWTFLKDWFLLTIRSLKSIRSYFVSFIVLRFSTNPITNILVKCSLFNLFSILFSLLIYLDFTVFHPSVPVRDNDNYWIYPDVLKKLSLTHKAFFSSWKPFNVLYVFSAHILKISHFAQIKCIFDLRQVWCIWKIDFIKKNCFSTHACDVCASS